MEISFDRKEILGKGGYGSVFKGSWCDRPVAVKRIELTQLTRDEQEEKRLRKLDHENVIKIFHAERDADFKYFALELCEASLDKLFLKDGDAKIYMGPIPSPEDSLRQMATGLEYMHSMKLVHRDVKPRNVFISINNNIAIMKWGDSDISNFVNEKGSFEAHFGVKGTINWMAPEFLEIFSKEDSQPSSDAGTTGDQILNLFLCDVFAEGSVFAYFLSGGQHPFGSKRQEILENVLGNNPVNLTSIPSSSAVSLIKKMLAKNPGDRISSSDVVKELAHINDQLKNDLKEVDSIIPSVNKTNKLLGQGGFTRNELEGVWEGVWRRQKVAIKKMNLNYSPLINEREKNLLKLNHPNVIKMYHIETDSDYRYFALELCAASLDKLFLKDNDPKKYRPKLSNGQSINMPPPQNVFSQLAEGMAHIHEQKLSHRDVKPLNVLIHVTNKLDSNHYKVTMKWADFGASKQVTRNTGEISMSGFKSTETWCAPEILEIYYARTKLDEKNGESVFIECADVFSEGLVFAYYLLEGEHPYGNWPHEASNIMKNDAINLKSNASINVVPKKIYV